MFAGVWVGGEVQRPQLSRNGHLYFQLVEKGAGDQLRASLGAVLFRRDRLRVTRHLREAGLELEEGQSLRCFGRLDFYAVSGRLQLVVRDVDPMFSLGALEHRRRQTLESLRAAELLERNSGLALSAVPLDLAVIASRGSAGALDLLATLRASGFGFRVRLLDAAVQGPTAEAEIAEALRRLDLELDSARARIDAYVLVRGGGSRGDLAVFDSRRIAEAVARARRPVLTGLGHEIDQSITDLVAHRAFKTPTGVGEFLCQRVAESESRLEDIVRRVALAAERRLLGARRRFERARRDLQSSGSRVARLGERIGDLERSLSRAARHSLARAERHATELSLRLRVPIPRRLERAVAECDRVASAFVEVSHRRLRQAAQALEGKARLCQQLSPDSVLRRGSSITRGADGRAIRSSSQARPGDRVSTEIAQGSFASVVEAASSIEGAGSTRMTDER